LKVTYRGSSRNHGGRTAADVDLIAAEGAGRAGIVIKGARSNVECVVWGLLGSPDSGKTLHRYFVSMSIQELALLVRQTMAKAPSAELLEAVVSGAVAALPRRGRKTK